MTRGIVWRFGGALLVVGAATACSSSDSRPGPVTVDVSIDVCAGSSCFVAPVPGATVVVDGPAAKSPYATGEDGTVTFTPNAFGGLYTVSASWGSAEGGPIDIAAPARGGATSVSIRLLKSATLDETD